MSRVIVFDAYGTILTPPKLDHGNPYQAISSTLEKYIVEAGAEYFMENFSKRSVTTKAMSFLGMAEYLEEAFHFKISDIDRQKIHINEELLALQVSMVKPYPDALEIWAYFRRKGYKLAIASNVAAEFYKPIETYFPDADYTFLSFAMNTLKPEIEFYDYLERFLPKTEKPRVFIGDRYDNDYRMPKNFGYSAYLIDRDGKNEGPDDIFRIPSLLALRELDTMDAL